MSLILAIETSQRVGGVALRDATGAEHVEMLSPKKRHDDDLLPAIDRAFAKARLQPDALRDGIVAVSIGPGGFTGLRIAISIAKMLAETLHVKIVAVPSALVASQSYQMAAKHNAKLSANLLVALASKGDSCWCTRASMANGIWTINGAPGLWNAQALDLSGIDVVLADEHFPEPMRQLCEVNGVEVIEPVFDPRACLLIADHMAREAQWTDPLLLLPLYPREPEAVTLWNKANPPASKQA